MRKITLVLIALFVSTVCAEQQSIHEFTKDMHKKGGFYDVYYQQAKDKLYLNITDFNQPFLFQSSLPRGIGSNDIGLDRGQLGQTRLVEFARFGNKVLLKQLNTAYRATSNNRAEQASIDEAFADSVIAGLPIVAQDDSGVLVDYTDFLFSDIHQVVERLKQSKQGNYRVDPARSGVYLPRSKSFVDNTELEALITYGGDGQGEYVRQVTPAPNSISVHLHHSLIRLPDNKYQPRPFHPYSGYWKMSYQDYSVPIASPMEKAFIPRHRLNKKHPSAAQSEAVEPIIYYLDPGIPEPLKSALYDGAMWWNQAFEAIGYKDAFQVKTLPKEADPMDIRYNVIQWVHRATRGWSYGTSVIDPRTGEILKGHVTLGSLRVRQDYLIALGLTSPFADGNTNTDQQQQMALARIRQLSAHEVGHTLGIAHNFAASANQRASVMDYPHPYIRIHNNQIDLSQAYDVGIGEWDKHVIAYGYQDVNQVRESAFLTRQINQTRALGLLYQSDPDARPLSAANAQGHLWDNGQDPLAELQRINQIRAFALQRFGLPTLAPGRSLGSLQETLVPIYYLHRYQLQAVAKLIGGVHYEYELKGDYPTPKGVTIIAPDRQRQAINALLNTMSPDYLALPESLLQLITPKAYGSQNTRESFQGRTGPTFDPISAGEAAAAFSLSLLLQPERLNRLAQQHTYNQEQPGITFVLKALFDHSFKTAPDQSDSGLQARLGYLALNQVMKSIQQGALPRRCVVKYSIY